MQDIEREVAKLEAGDTWRVTTRSWISTCRGPSTK